MNIHPLLVHFPVALLSLFSILEILRFKKLTRLHYWFYLKAVLVIIGSLATIPTFLTGEIAEELIDKSEDPLVELHSKFAFTSAFLYGIIALAYLIAWIQREAALKIQTPDAQNTNFFRVFHKFSDLIMSPTFLVSLTVLALAFLFITGELGTMITYGNQSALFKNLPNLLQSR